MKGTIEDAYLPRDGKDATIAVLLFDVGTSLAQDSYRIDSDITIEGFSGSRVERLYEFLCAEYGVHGGTPIPFSVCAIFEPTPSRTCIPHFGDPYSDIDRFCNAIAIQNGSAVILTQVALRRS